MLWHTIRYAVNNALFALPLLVDLAARSGSGLPPQSVAGHSANDLGQLGNCRQPRRALRTLCNGVSRHLWVDDRRPF